MLFGIVLLKFHLHDMCGLCDPKHCVVRFLACSPQLPVTNSLKLELYALRAIKGSLAPPGYNIQYLIEYLFIDSFIESP